MDNMRYQYEMSSSNRARTRARQSAEGAGATLKDAERLKTQVTECEEGRPEREQVERFRRRVQKARGRRRVDGRAAADLEKIGDEPAAVDQEQLTSSFCTRCAA